ncbi:MAG: hypothetical protein Q8P11_00055 [bacterium]|nr:hypothetical protein [bacterium]
MKKPILKKEVSTADVMNVTRQEQYHAIDELFEHSRPSFSYYLLLGISSVIITCGILLENTVIVIGGMLVTPVLTPILAIGLAIQVGNKNIFARLLFLVISGVRNHTIVKYPYGSRNKQCIQLCGQLFERKEVCFLRFI